MQLCINPVRGLSFPDALFWFLQFGQCVSAPSPASSSKSYMPCRLLYRLTPRASADRYITGQPMPWESALVSVYTSAQSHRLHSCNALYINSIPVDRDHSVQGVHACMVNCCWSSKPAAASVPCKRKLHFQGIPIHKAEGWPMWRADG